LGYTPREVHYDDSTFTVMCLDREGKEHSLEGDALLVATGIKPWTDCLGLENTNVELDGRGFIKVDEYLRTTAENIWAIGDCIGRYLYRHTVNFEGEYLLRTLFEEPRDEPIDYPPIPHAIFTHPQVAGVGKTEEELKAEGVNYVVGLNRYADSAMGMALRSEMGFVKVLFDKNTRRLLGAHIIGDEASNMIHMLIAYMNMKATIDDMLRTIYIHPALPEIIRNAVRKACATWHEEGAEIF